MQQRHPVTAENDGSSQRPERWRSPTPVRPVVDAAGNVVGALECVTDLTAVKRAARISNKVAQFQSQQSQVLTENLQKLSAGDLNFVAHVAEGDADTAAARESFAQIAGAVQQVVQTLQNLSADAKNLSQAAAAGQLETRADEARYQGEYRQILHGMNQSLAGFETPIRDIARSSSAWPTKISRARSRRTIRRLRATAGQRQRGGAKHPRCHPADQRKRRSVRGRIARDRREFQSLASGAQSQSSSVEEMSASIEELARSIDAVKENASQANEVASQANQLAEQGGQAVQKSVESMGQIRTSSTQIAEIIQVISEIASQTNLLALERGHREPPRAGEHGMGFAVVADEVRKLAERSNQAAREISTLIKESTQRVEEGAQLSDQTGRVLEADHQARPKRPPRRSPRSPRPPSSKPPTPRKCRGRSKAWPRSRNSRAAGSEEMALQQRGTRRPSVHPAGAGGPVHRPLGHQPVALPGGDGCGRLPLLCSGPPGERGASSCQWPVAGKKWMAPTKLPPIHSPRAPGHRPLPPTLLREVGVPHGVCSPLHSNSPLGRGLRFRAHLAPPQNRPAKRSLRC